MDIEIIAIGVGITSLLVLPFVAINKSKNTKHKAQKQELNQIAASVQSDVATFDFGLDFAIGLSSAKNYIFYHKKTQGGSFAKHIPINTIKSCRANEIKRKVKMRKHSEDMLCKLELVFTFNDDETPPCNLTFYDSDEHYQINGEYALAKKWEAIVNEAMAFYIL